MSSDNPDPVAGLPLPPPGFDPRKASVGELEAFRLPAKPDRVAEPAMWDLWHAMFASPVTFVPLTSTEVRLPGRTTGGEPAALLGGGLPKIPWPRRPLTSANWSGGFAYPQNGTRFVQVCATWIVPATRQGLPDDAPPPSLPPEAGPPQARLPHRCSIWIGIDGRRRWAAAMPQLGTEHRDDGSARFWWQWWTPRNRRQQFYVKDLEARSGDRVYCNLSVVGDATVRFHFMNRTQGTFGTVEVAWPGHARGTSAQWVLERPGAPILIDGEIYNAGLHPMPDFGTVTLDGFAAKAVTAGSATRCMEFDHLKLRTVSNRTTRSQPRRTMIVSRATRDRNSRKLVLEYRG